MIYVGKVQTKLNAILAKDVESIVAAHVALPYLGTNYTASALRSWLQVRSDQLTAILSMTDADVTTEISTIRATLSAGDQAIADKIVANQPYAPTFSGAQGYGGCVKIMLLHFARTP